MDDKMLEMIEKKVKEAIKAVMEDSMDELEGTLQDVIEDSFNDSIMESFSEGIEEFLSSHQFVLADGTILQTKQKTRVMSPDKKKVLICYGGMRVDGKTLSIQTRISCWVPLCVFETEEKAVEALQKANAAIEQGLSLIEL